MSKTVPAPKVVRPTGAELKRMDQLIAVHLFGYRWFYFQNDAGTDKWCGIQLPRPWVERHGGKQVDHPAPGDRLDTTVPRYHEDALYLLDLMNKCLERDPEHPLQLWQLGDHSPFAYCYGDIQKDHYPTIQLALCAYVIRLFKLESCPTYGC